MYTGDSNVNVVGVEASADVTTSVAFLITLENGTIVCVGVPFSTVLISIATGISKSFCWKNRSILVKNTPPTKFSSCIKNVCASGSDHKVLSSVNFCSSICALRTDIIVSCVVCRIPVAAYSVCADDSDSPDTVSYTHLTLPTN